MKIYKYYNGKVHELEVRETKKLYISDVNSGLAFDCNRRFDKYTPTTPLEAIQEKINVHLTSIGMYKDRIQKIDSDLGQLRKLEKSYS